ncbi:PorT family protein [Emticicia fluvialis]|uniref:PorT family protein n=1 Tax=Emticicia fluvialis TaxID=2974474 RepID=UPI002166A93F|nr:PorT family protein [Emticicia fluvialis]
MKRIGLILLILLGGISVKAAYKQDTTIVEFTDKGVKKRVTVYTSGNKDFELPRNLNLENVLKTLGVDSAERRRTIALLEQNNAKQDTLVIAAADGRSVKIITSDAGDLSRKDKEDNDHWSRSDTRDNEEEKSSETRTWSSKPEKKSSNSRFFSKSDFGIYLGLNNWANGPSTVPDLQTWGSRFVALSFQRNATLINGKQVDFAISYGPEIAWNNFMFEGNNYIDNSTGKIEFFKSAKDLNKSKLVVTSLNLPIMFNFGFEEAKFKIGLGGYVGYRVGSYRKLKYSDSSKKEINKDNYGLNDFRYGLVAEIGKRRGITFFGRYDMGELFKSSQENAAGLQAWTIGIRL